MNGHNYYSLVEMSAKASLQSQLANVIFQRSNITVITDYLFKELNVANVKQRDSQFELWENID